VALCVVEGTAQVIHVEADHAYLGASARAAEVKHGTQNDPKLAQSLVTEKAQGFRGGMSQART
jgi:hypothetical protein